MIDADDLPLVVERAQNHDPDAWEELYRHSRPSLVQYARRRLDDHAAEDAVSEAFMRAMAQIQSFTWQRAGFNAWMYGITRNVVLETYRHTARDQSLKEKQTSTIDLTAPAEVGDGIEAAQERDLLVLAFARLSDSDQEILDLRVVGGLSSDEVAVVIDKKPSAVRMAQARALERLRTAMKELEDA